MAMPSGDALQLLTAMMLSTISPASGTDSAQSQINAPRFALVSMESVSCPIPAHWIGQKVDDAALKGLNRPYRVLSPDSAATQDFNSDRLNILTNAKGIVTGIRCG
jgi:hypothetical protein